MALTATEEALVRDLIAQEDELLSLAANEPTIISKLGATKVTLSDLMAASAGDLTDLFLTRQGTDDRSMTMDLLRQFILAQGAVTPPQFDNDTSLATTAFVQRALGNMQVSKSVADNAVLTGADAGSHIIGIVSTSTLTLPDANNLPDGSSFKISAGAAALDVWRSSTNLIYSYLGAPDSGKTTYSLLSNETADFICYSGNWYVVAATGGAVFSFNGYQKLPSGLIIQWGSFSAPGGTTTTLNLPIAFTTAGYAITANFGIPAEGTVNMGFAGLTQYKVQSKYSGGQSGAFIAVGR